MSFNIEHFKNKIKRVIIQIHHNKNKLGRNAHVIDKRDPTKPLLTLRVNGTDEEDDDIQYQFESFNDQLTPVHEQEEFQTEFADDLECEGEDRDSCAIGVIQAEELRSQMLEQQRYLEDSIRNNIHYIEKEVKPRRKFWFFGKRLPISYAPEATEAGQEPADKIMIISQSSQTSPLPIESQIEQEYHYQTRAKPPTPRSQERFELQQVNSVVSLEAFRTSSFSRKNLKSINSMLNLSASSIREQKCACAVCEKKTQKPAEPWKVILNDISLQAALLSTGSRVPSKQSQNIVADFTTSKHQESITNSSDWITFGPVAEDLAKLSIANDENRVLESDLLELASNDSKIDLRPESKTISSISKIILSEIKNNSRPSTQYTKTSMISELIEADTYKQAETSAVYDGVFQDYNYSDESLQHLHPIQQQQLKQLGDSTQPLLGDTLPLSISSKRRAKRYF